MKKLISILLTVVFLIINSCTVIAVGPSVDNSTYKEPPVIIDGGGIAGGAAKTILPKTGGVPAELFYLAGLLIIITAIVLLRLKSFKAKGQK